MIVFSVLNFLVGVSSWMIVSRGKRDSLSDTCIDWFCFYYAQIIISEIMLGVFDVLHLEYLVAIHTVVAAFIYVFFYRKKTKNIFAGKKNAIKEIFQHRTALLLASIIVAFGLVKISINFVNPPFGWDCLNYHFTFPVEWLKNGNLDNPITVFGDPSPPYYPMHGSLFFFWLMAPLKNVFLADLGQVPFFIAALFALYGIGRKIGLSREYSFYSSGLFFIIPNFFKQLEIAYVDVMVATLFFICLNYVLQLHKQFSLKKVFLFGLSFGLFIGIKTVSLAYGILLFVPFCAILFFHRKGFLKPLLIFIVCVVVFGGFTYIRNFIDTGNPLYPFDFELLGKTIFEGVMDKATYGAHFTRADYSLSKLLFHEGLSGQGIVFMFLPAFLTLPLMIIRKRKKVTFMLAYFSLLPLLIYFIYRYIIPLGNTRYLYPLFGIGMIVGFLFFSMIPLHRVALIALTSLCALASMSTLASHGELACGIISSLLLFATIVFLGKKGFPQKIHINYRKALPILFIALVVILIILNHYYINNEFRRYLVMQEYSGFWPDATRAWKWLNDNTEGAQIAYAGRPVPFPLYGSGFKNNVYYVSVNTTEPAKLHYFPKGRYRWGADALEMHENFKKQGNYRQNPSYSTWLSNLKERKTNYLFIYSLQHTKDIIFPLEDSWAKGHPDIFKEVFSEKTIRIYKIIQ